MPKPFIALVTGAHSLSCCGEDLRRHPRKYRNVRRAQRTVSFKVPLGVTMSTVSGDCCSHGRPLRVQSQVLRIVHPGMGSEQTVLIQPLQDQKRVICCVVRALLRVLELAPSVRSYAIITQCEAGAGISHHQQIKGILESDSSLKRGHEGHCSLFSIHFCY